VSPKWISTLAPRDAADQTTAHRQAASHETAPSSDALSGREPRRPTSRSSRERTRARGGPRATGSRHVCDPGDAADTASAFLKSDRPDGPGAGHPYGDIWIVRRRGGRRRASMRDRSGRGRPGCRDSAARRVSPGMASCALPAARRDGPVSTQRCHSIPIAGG
jgi:hypothetical protein